MSSKDIFLLSSSPEILQLYKDNLRENGCRLITSSRLRPGSRKKKSSSLLIIVESKDNWAEGLANLHDPTLDSCACIIIGSSKALKENLYKVNWISRLFFDNNHDIGPGLQRSQENGISLVDLLEKKISEFVLRTKSDGGKDLYPVLIREIERHLIRLILKEAEGNQVKAAQILGINRNTLRKKIRELKISLK